MLRQLYHKIRRTRVYYMLFEDLGFIIEWNGSDWHWLDKIANQYQDKRVDEIEQGKSKSQ